MAMQQGETPVDTSQNIVIIMQDENGCQTTIDGGSISTSTIRDAMAAQGIPFRFETSVVNDPKAVEIVTMDAIAGNEVEVHPPADFTSGSNSSCLVCGDRASGFHYSVFSCEGCKGFFKRSVQKNFLYHCKEGSACCVNRFTRNACQACRFQKCVQTGMKREAVREDRSPGAKNRVKRLRGIEAPSPLVRSDGSWGFTKSKEILKNPVLENLVGAAPEICPKYDDHNLVGPNSGSISVTELMQCGYTELKYIIAWAKKVQGFVDLCMEDQMALLKSSFMELIVLRLAYRSMGYENTVKFADGLLISADVVQNMGWGKELISATLEFASRLKEVRLDLTEYCVLNAIVLSYPDAAGIQDRESVITLQSSVLSAMRHYIVHNHASDSRRYGKMLLRLPALRTVSAKAAERFLSLTLDGNMQLNDLVFEMIN